MTNFLKHKRSVITVKSKTFSFVTSVIVALLLKENSNNYIKDYGDLTPKQLRLQPAYIFNGLREKITNDASKYLGYKPTRINELRKFLTHLGFDLVIFCSQSHYRIINEKAIKQNSNGKKIFLLKSVGEFGKKNHYDVLRKPSGFFGKFLCKLCFKTSRNKTIHVCKFKCYMCKSSKRHDRNLTPKTLLCIKCNRYFYSRYCKAAHITNKICDRKKICLKCESLYIVKKTKEHRCKTKDYCISCKIIHPQNRHFIKSGFKAPDNFPNILIFDFETFNDKNNVVTPYLCVSRLYDIENIFDYSDPNFQPKDCLFTEKIFYGLDCAKNFFLYLTSGLLPKKTVVVAHNGQKFDFYFFLTYFYESKIFIPSLVINGSSLMQMVIKTNDVDLRFIDSVNFIPAQLRNFPSLFGFQDSKTYFPYSFMNENTIYFKGDIPATSFYEVGQNDEIEFNSFYDEQKKLGEWDVEKVATDYCIQDVHVLFCGIFTYMRTFYLAANLNPFA